MIDVNTISFRAVYTMDELLSKK